MKIVLDMKEVDKIIMDYLQSQGKIEKNKRTVVSWNWDKSGITDPYISVEQ